MTGRGMDPHNKPYGRLFWSVLTLSACTFGGGFVILPLMRKKFVQDLGWIDEQEMLDLTAIAQSSPGAIAVNAAILVGYRVAGLPGAALTALGAVLPPLVILSVISLFYQAFRANPLIAALLGGMVVGVAAVIADVTVTLIRGILEHRRLLPVLVLIAAFAAVRFFQVNLLLVILLCGCIGAADTLYRGRKGAGA